MDGCAVLFGLGLGLELGLGGVGSGLFLRFFFLRFFFLRFAFFLGEGPDDAPLRLFRLEGLDAFGVSVSAPVPAPAPLTSSVNWARL